ncbi:GyrI-like domain-containing protein [Paenibacillus sp. WQ 127069]|uniref:GyrI-like domain-containing protein n=1 Tax=Paenibacillus baimaensis TaxID=2982185 RepID=A0ABT2UVW1_9BACL|nr:GyrI-like domain-containing protein [Paenibacillus sp. WQ 127069]MCU6797937.1 GyrI-like domain-containing protein [Paenibacillus sp. WQ 127069]
MQPTFKPSLNPVIESKPAYHAIGLRQTHVFSEGGIPSIVDQWSLFMSRIGEIQGQHEVTIGVCYDVQPGNPFEYVTAAVLAEAQLDNPVPESMCKIFLKPQTYAIFTHTGPISDLGATYKVISEWLASNETYVRAQAPELEYYDSRYTGNERADNEFDIYIPVVSQ